MTFTRLTALGIPGRSYSFSSSGAPIFVFVPTAVISMTAFDPALTLAYPIRPGVVVLNIQGQTPTVIVLNNVVPTFVPLTDDYVTTYDKVLENISPVPCPAPSESSAFEQPFKSCDYS